MPRAKEGETSCAEVYGFALGGAEPRPYGRNSALLQGRDSALPDGEILPSSKGAFLVYHSFC